MERFRKLPFLSGCTAAVLAGIASFAARADSQTTYIRMAVMMLAFFILGVYVRNTVYTINKQNAVRKKEQELEEEQRLKRMKEEKIAEALAKKNAENRTKAAHTINMTAGDADQDSFEAMNFAQAVRTKAKE